MCRACSTAWNLFQTTGGISSQPSWNERRSQLPTPFLASKFQQELRAEVAVSTALTTWKEIAAYLGKGVRTAQRWEHELGLPVRRPNHRKGFVLAIPEELDAWLRSQPQNIPDNANSQLKQLAGAVAKLERENATLRRELQRSANQPPVSDGNREHLQALQHVLLEHCSRSVGASTDHRLECAESIDMSRNIRAIRSLQNRSAVDRPLFEAQILVMLTCCTIAEDDLLYGRIDEARELIRRLRQICQSVLLRLSGTLLPDSRTNAARERLSELQTRILTIESRFAA